ncbi:protein PLANT CADMIUM RESISTANCE 7-like [Aristolochia californica]|uniref:protein PLANT CADMIUM RESISTANCE 7-like n=1 Tax=Aristolochia californica TaxID=171875 RepID=UPI0035DDC3D3
MAGPVLQPPPYTYPSTPPPQYGFSHPPANYGPNNYLHNAGTDPTLVSPVVLPQPTVANGIPTHTPAMSISTPVQQMAGGAVAGTMPWTTGLFDCMEDPTNALATAFFPCVTFGQIAEILDNGNSTCATSGIIYAVTPCMLSRGYRRKLRRAFGLVEAPAPDWLTHSLFEWCALCQEYRELNNRGINPALGWRGNVDKTLQSRQQTISTAPPMNQTMNYPKPLF